MSGYIISSTSTSINPIHLTFDNNTSDTTVPTKRAIKRYIDSKVEPEPDDPNININDEKGKPADLYFDIKELII
jgi:hypothetical protein